MSRFKEAQKDFIIKYLLTSLDARNYNILQTSKELGVSRNTISKYLGSTNMNKSSLKRAYNELCHDLTE